jgi:hypothetical protein
LDAARSRIVICAVWITDTNIKAVAFLCQDESTPTGTVRSPRATAFFVLVPNDDAPPTSYVVTAAHCVLSSGTEPLYLRVNVDDSFRDLPIPHEAWFIHDDADVAATPFPGTGFKGLGAYPIDQFVGPDLRALIPNTFVVETDGKLSPTDSHPILVGDEVAVVGLFVQHAGTKQNLPVVRFGRIARMPSEPIAVEFAGVATSIVTYVVELSSWGGISGSPALWAKPSVHLMEVDAPAELRHHGDKVLVQDPDAHATACLGLVSGHFDVPQPVRAPGSADEVITVPLNSGLALVTPAHFIRDLLMREDVAESRNGSSTGGGLGR